MVEKKPARTMLDSSSDDSDDSDQPAPMTGDFVEEVKASNAIPRVS